ncbi:MAG TPA: hypothetical protein VM686_15285 [Polyangiaceae bacterium]|jgi:hypothetical protein|nr:hypothetical protein [Polyangiaceae bacterium]
MSRVAAYGFGFALLAAVAAPGFGDPNQDSYPLSTYPMFARPREKPLLHFVEGVDQRGRPVRLPPGLVANAEVMQAAARVRRAVAAGEEASASLCASVAERVAGSREHKEVVRVRIVSARFDPIRYFEVGPEPEERTVHVQCKVKRRR